MANRIVTKVSNYTEILSIGGIDFKKGGEFKIIDGRLLVDVAERGYVDRHIVYAHVVDGVVVYIGESSHSFRDRVRLYITHDGKTNRRVRDYIMASSEKVEVYYFKPQAFKLNDQLTVNPYIGIEQALISLVKPELNKKDVA